MGQIGLAVVLGGCLMGMNPNMALANPYADVPAEDTAYADIRKLAEAGLVNRLYVNFDEHNLATRYEMAAATANVSSKYDQASPENQEIIRRLQQKFAAELTLMGLTPTSDGKLEEKLQPSEHNLEAKTSEVEEKTDALETRTEKLEERVNKIPHFFGEAKQIYDYKRSSKHGSHGSYNALYEDIRFGVTGDLSKD